MSLRARPCSRTWHTLAPRLSWPSCRAFYVAHLLKLAHPRAMHIDIAVKQDSEVALMTKFVGACVVRPWERHCIAIVATIIASRAAIRSSENVSRGLAQLGASMCPSTQQAALLTKTSGAMRWEVAAEDEEEEPSDVSSSRRRRRRRTGGRSSKGGVGAGDSGEGGGGLR